MNIEERLSRLKNIEEVEAPPFLLTRIKQNINDLNKKSVPLQWKWTFVTTSIAIIGLNLSIFYHQIHSDQKPEISTLIETMQLTSSNELYHE